MRGIPQKLGTKQDLFNVCANLHHAEAAIFLKDQDPELLTSLGITTADLKKIRADLAARKRTEDAANKEKLRHDQEIAETTVRIAALEAAIETERLALRKAEEVASEIGALEAEWAATQRDLNAIRIGDALRPVSTIEAEIADQETVLRQAHAAGDVLPVKESEQKALQEELAEVQGLLNRLSKMRPAGQIIGDIEAINAELHDLRDAATQLESAEKAIGGLGRERIEAMEALRQGALGEDLKQKLTEADNHLRSAKDAAMTAENARQNLAVMETELAEAKVRLSTLAGTQIPSP